MPETIMEKPKGKSKSITEEEVKAAEKLVQLVVFDLGGEEYGLGITEVKEIVKTGEITYVPNTPDFIRGIINLRGKMVVVMDMKNRFMIEREDEWKGKHIIIIERGENTYGLMVDEVSEVLRLPEDAIKEAPEIITTRIHADYLKGVGTLEDRLIIVLNLDKVLAEDDLAKLAQTAERHWHKAKTKKTEKEAKPEEAAPEKKIEKEEKETKEQAETTKEAEEPETKEETKEKAEIPKVKKK